MCPWTPQMGTLAVVAIADPYFLVGLTLPELGIVKRRGVLVGVSHDPFSTFFPPLHPCLGIFGGFFIAFIAQSARRIKRGPCMSRHAPGGAPMAPRASFFVAPHHRQRATLAPPHLWMLHTHASWNTPMRGNSLGFSTLMNKRSIFCYCKVFPIFNSFFFPFGHVKGDKES